eukprot:scaffold4343_cov144-Cylindrotheca_fusiformis.AAC.12
MLNSMQFSLEVSASTDKSHEYELLKEMVRLQPPVEAPVHPRALGYKPRSQFGPTLEYEERKQRSRWTKPRLFQLSERQSYNPRGKKSQTRKRYDVIARNKIGPWGEAYSLGTTKEQLKEDRRLLEGTYLDARDGSNQHVVFRETGSVRSIIRMLQVASRGQFLKPQTESSISFCSCWMQPTERWFSLSLYLASRYQVSLWESFKETATNPIKPIKYETSILRAAIPAGVKNGIKRAMEIDRERTDYLRDSICWSTISSLSGKSSNGKDWESLYMSWMQMPLLQIDQPVSQLQALVRWCLQQSLAAEIEKSILCDQNPVTTRPTNKTRKKRKKKNKKRGGRGQIRPTVEATLHDENDSEGNVEPRGHTSQPFLEYPRNDTSPRSRNRNVIFALSILEDVMEAAFERVGLESEIAEEFSVGKIEESKTERQQPYFRARTTNGPQKNRARETVQEPSKSNDHLPSGNTQNVRIQATDFELPRSQLPLPMSSSQMESFRLPGSLTSQASFSQSGLPTDFYRAGPMEVFSFGRTGEENALDEWLLANRYQIRERSILTDFFQSQEERSDDDEKLMAASTAASISSSTYKDSTFAVETEEMEKGTPEEPTLAVDMVTINEDNNSLPENGKNLPLNEKRQESNSMNKSERILPLVPATEIVCDMDSDRKLDDLATDRMQTSYVQSSSEPMECRSPSPEAPSTPPPTLSPILLSLADLKDLRHSSLTPEWRPPRGGLNNPTRTFSDAPIPGSLPNSPARSEKDAIAQSWSREDLRIATFRDDHRLKQKRIRQPRPHRTTDFPQTYKSVAVKSLAKPIASSKSGTIDFRTHFLEASHKRDQQTESCARSETAVEGQREDHQLHDSRKQVLEESDNKSVIKDETTTITSALSQREAEDVTSIREGKGQKERAMAASLLMFSNTSYPERNTFRDLCLTLGAEVAMLKAVLAAHTATTMVAPFDYTDPFNQHQYGPGSFDPNGMPPFFYGMKRGQRAGAMSDAGIHRGGDHESQVSEDDGFDAISKTRADAARQMSSTATVAGSDASIEITTSVTHGKPIGKVPEYDSSLLHGLQSRLSKDIMRFLNSTGAQLKKQDGKRTLAIERFTRLVHTIWPRAQVKLYGSHVAGLCLPSSDLDFVVCLPAVHKNAPALAPGVLEGRNAINESSQKLLARELKGEWWVDPRSIKLIERTVVPVIKVSTKDTRARTIQLDISFDSPEHHGLEALAMVSQILDELPLIRPLMLVLKQFLLDRGLLTSYTGGLSSYCLFLMVARYLQEQPSSVGDCGSLLMGFLDFYGNYFDPRATGISVRRRQYFVRPNYAVASYQAVGQGIPVWTPPSPHPPHVSPGSPPKGSRDFLRRNSFSDAGSVDSMRRIGRTHRLAPAPRYASHTVSPAEEMNSSFGHGRPFTFDPLFVEDPLAAGNNVGRNAFRIFQVQRAFSDAHRALVASLEWDINSSGDLNDDVDYPLLKCLLQSEDVLYEL